MGAIPQGGNRLPGHPWGIAATGNRAGRRVMTPTVPRMIGRQVYPGPGDLGKPAGGPSDVPLTVLVTYA